MIRLRLYVTGHTVSAERARTALRDVERRLAAQQGEGQVFTEVIDVLDDPECAGRDQVFATPTLIRLAPGPQLRLFGDLSAPDKLIQARFGLGAPVFERCTTRLYEVPIGAEPVVCVLLAQGSDCKLTRVVDNGPCRARLGVEAVSAQLIALLPRPGNVLFAASLVLVDRVDPLAFAL